MFHLDNNSGISAMPAPAAAQSSAPRWFTEGGGNNSPSWPGQDWFNIVQAELLSVLSAAGLAPEKTEFNQLALAIKAIVTSNALQQDENLSDLKDVAEACKNLGLKSAAFVDAQESIGDATPDRALISGLATAANVGAVPATGGDVAFLDNSEHYATKDGIWAGGGGFYNQMADRRALFYSAGFTAQAGNSIFLPLTKATVQTQGLGYLATISHGLLVSGGSDFPRYCIHIIRDMGDGTFKDSLWTFDPNDDSFIAAGRISAPGEIRGGANIVAEGGLFESGGAVRAYSPNNPQPIDLSWLASIDWVNQLINQVKNWAQTSFVSRTQYGAAAYYPAPGNSVSWDFQAPAGCTLSGISVQETGSNSADNIGGVFYKPQQDLINGVWVTVQG